MKTQQMLPTNGVLLFSMLLFPSLLSPQRPPTPGKLSVTSSPQQGAKIMIDDQDTGHATNFTFVVSPGDHYVSLPSLPNCKNPMKVTVSSGSPQSVNCDAATGWPK
jgi:PEGA domain